MLSWGTARALSEHMGDVSTWGFAEPAPDPGKELPSSKAARLDWGPAPQEPHAPEEEAHVQWSLAGAQHQAISWAAPQEQEDTAEQTVNEEERARKASGRSRKGSFYPGHNPAHDQQAAARFRHRPASGEPQPQQPSRGASTGSASRGSTAGERGHRTRPGTAFHATTANRGGSAESSQEGVAGRARRTAAAQETAASLAFGYQPYSLREYREQHYDAKREGYWELGRLGPGPESSELHVRASSRPCLLPDSMHG
jgi:hypothetical protein